MPRPSARRAAAVTRNGWELGLPECGKQEERVRRHRQRLILQSSGGSVWNVGANMGDEETKTTEGKM